MADHLFEDRFLVTKVDFKEKKFENVSRIEAKSEGLDVYMLLDVATKVFPMKAGEKFNMVLASTLNLDGTPDSGYYTEPAGKTLADDFDYVMQGKLYKITEEKGKVEMYASFGGLLMMLRGHPSTAVNMELDQRLFLLIKKL